VKCSVHNLKLLQKYNGIGSFYEINVSLIRQWPEFQL
jgi:hypothetical protein